MNLLKWKKDWFEILKMTIGHIYQHLILFKPEVARRLEISSCPDSDYRNFHVAVVWKGPCGWRNRYMVMFPCDLLYLKGMQSSCEELYSYIEDRIMNAGREINFGE